MCNTTKHRDLQVISHCCTAPDQANAPLILHRRRPEGRSHNSTAAADLSWGCAAAEDARTLPPLPPTARAVTAALCPSSRRWLRHEVLVPMFCISTAGTKLFGALDSLVS